TVRAHSSRVPTSLPDDPYVAVRQAHLVDTDTESGPVEDLRETEAHTPATVDTESEPEEAPSETGRFEASEPSDTKITSSYSSNSSDSTAPLSLEHPLTQTSPTPTPTRDSFYRRTVRMAVRTQPTLSLGMSARIAKASALSPSSFRKRYRSSYETSSSSPSALHSRKSYRGTSELVEDTEDESSDLSTERVGSGDEGHGSEDEGPSLEEEEEAAPEGHQQAVPAEDIVVDEPLRLGYGALRRRELVIGEGEMPNTFEVGQSSRSVPEHEGAEMISAFRQPTLVTWVDPEDGRVYTDIPTYVPPVAPVQTPSSLAVPTPVASPVTTPAATITVDEDEFLEVGAQLELYGSILYDHTQCLDALPPALFRILKREQERATVTFSAIWRPRENHDLRMQIAEERRERLELTYRVARIERRHESKGEY
ncbi:hypothetical protein Tco_0883691, partial [Tanacetum coccineum]